MNSFVTQEQFNLFHSIDRELYTILVINLWRDPAEAMQIMALWLWLERAGFNNVVDKMLSLPSTLINGLADEALICLGCINNNQFALSSDNFDIPLLQSLMEKDISLQFFVQNQLSAIQGIAKVTNEVCIRAFSDIMQQAIDRNVAQRLADSQMAPSPSCLQTSTVQPVGFPQMNFGSSDALPQTLSQQVPADDRTMFVTFSKGYPVLEEEVRHFFMSAYGDCIESLHMQEVQRNEQSLYATIVFHSASTIERILNGKRTVKFSIKGRHVWARKFVPKRPRSFLLPSSQRQQ